MAEEAGKDAAASPLLQLPEELLEAVVETLPKQAMQSLREASRAFRGPFPLVRRMGHVHLLDGRGDDLGDADADAAAEDALRLVTPGAAARTLTLTSRRHGDGGKAADFLHAALPRLRAQGTACSAVRVLRLSCHLDKPLAQLLADAFGCGVASLHLLGSIDLRGFVQAARLWQGCLRELHVDLQAGCQPPSDCACGDELCLRARVRACGLPVAVRMLGDLEKLSIASWDSAWCASPLRRLARLRHLSIGVKGRAKGVVHDLMAVAEGCTALQTLELRNVARVTAPMTMLVDLSMLVDPNVVVWPSLRSVVLHDEEVGAPLLRSLWLPRAAGLQELAWSRRMRSADPRKLVGVARLVGRAAALDLAAALSPLHLTLDPRGFTDTHLIIGLTHVGPHVSSLRLLGETKTGAFKWDSGRMTARALPRARELRLDYAATVQFVMGLLVPAYMPALELLACERGIVEESHDAYACLCKAAALRPGRLRLRFGFEAGRAAEADDLAARLALEGSAAVAVRGEEGADGRRSRCVEVDVEGGEGDHETWRQQLDGLCAALGMFTPANNT